MGLEVVQFNQSVDYAVSAWLSEKLGRTGSERTHAAYRQALDDFRMRLRSTGSDLDGDPTLIAQMAQAWAGLAYTKDTVSPATYNTRLSVLSSFYEYCIRHDLLITHNPIRRCARRPVQRFAKAEPLSPSVVKQRLTAIDRSTAQGRRDYALLLMALTTGRRLSELARLEWTHCSNPDGQVIITWEHTKGGKTLRDKLPLSVSMALADWQSCCEDLSGRVWISLSHNGTYGKPLSIQALGQICHKRLGTSKFHSLRHTFAHIMEDLGAKVSVIQRRLGHSNIGTTGQYLESMRSDENEYAGTIADMFA